MIFIFWLKWLHLGQFAYGDYESEIDFFYLVKIFRNLQFKTFTFTIVKTACFKKHPVLLCQCC